MKRFILRTIIFFILPIIFLGIGYEVLLRNTPNDETYKRNYMEHHAVEIETLILGNSHSFFGINPEQFSMNTFNLADVARPMNYDFRLFDVYKDKMKNLKTIILPLSYHSLFRGKEIEGESEWVNKNYQMYYKIETSRPIKYNYEILNTEYQMGLKRILDYYIFRKNLLTCSNLGWGLSYSKTGTHEMIQSSGKIAAERHKKDLNDPIVKENIKRNIDELKNLITYAKKRNINVLLIQLPVYDSYKENLDAIQLNKTIKVLTDLSKQNSNCYYYNFINDDNFSETDFYDGDHLAKKGADKISKKLDSIITSQ